MTTTVNSEYISNGLRWEINKMLVDYVVAVANDCITYSLNGENVKERIAIATGSEHHRHHERYNLDTVVEGFANDALRPVIEFLERNGIQVSKRIEHSSDNPTNPGSRYVLCTNYVEGSDNFANAIRERAIRLKEGRTPGEFNPQAVGTVALIDTYFPYEPVSTAVYHFYNDEVYSSITLLGPGGERDPVAFTGRERSVVDPNRLLEQVMFPQETLRFFVGNYKFGFPQGIAAFESSLIEHGVTRTCRVDTTNGSCATASNVLQVIDGKSYHAYIDPRHHFQFPSSVTVPPERLYAKLLYTNVIAVLPIARGFGFKVTDLDENAFWGKEGEGGGVMLPLTDKDNPNSNQEINIIIARPELFEASGFNLMAAIIAGKELAARGWEEHVLQVCGNKE
ncbi:hypothetical protein J4460_05380 [Candidatus Woesearchaeota archaeon]|nr:hypothetical protein [Candidatus Woesearchaeota archaeon]HIH38129.1 hypothetical protein [Candidatus Woesearchaeota archaeon]HIH49578.1 hypothetical protein [Candidatus Woesearchaeota archaeon]HIJ04388.1 hypothetical protein [Candidatus Woesearchaeota archaeon]